MSSKVKTPGGWSDTTGWRVKTPSGWKKVVDVKRKTPSGWEFQTGTIQVHLYSPSLELPSTRCFSFYINNFFPARRSLDSPSCGVTPSAWGFYF